jgi:hypothetical protein
VHSLGGHRAQVIAASAHAAQDDTSACVVAVVTIVRAGRWDSERAALFASVIRPATCTSSFRIPPIPFHSGRRPHRRRYAPHRRGIGTQEHQLQTSTIE